MVVIIPLFLATLFLTVSRGNAFTALYVFGDSLSDTGRKPPTGTNYWEGRYSNGPLWVEYLSTNLGMSYNASNNWAISGSTTSNLLAQIANVPPSTNLNSALFTLVSGGNDFFDSLKAGVNDPFWSIVVQNAVQNLTNAADTLYTNGARELIIANLANLGQTPAFTNTPPGWPEYVDSKVALFNSELAAAVTNVAARDTGLRIYFMNANATFEQIFTNASFYGFTVITNGALEDTSLTDKSFTGPGADYLFWDTLHPTTKADALTAGWAYQYVAAKLNIAQSGTNFSLVASNLYPGLPYTIQTSTNLLSWAPFQTITPLGTNATVIWTNWPQSQGFYRVQY
jgi:phospholipase/lecithinase/hemolysin